MGPNGVSHEEEMEAYITTHNKTKQISREIKEKGHSITKIPISNKWVERKMEEYENQWNAKLDKTLLR